MTNLFEKFKTEDDFEVNGIWKTYQGAAKIKLARAGNKNMEYSKCLAKVAEDLDGKDEKDPEKETREDRDKPWIEVYARSVIKGWQVKDGDKWVDGIHLPDSKGNIIIKPYSIDNVVKALLALPDFFDIIRKDANNIKTFQKEKEEKEIKN